MAAVTAYFARRTTEPQTVADLTTDTFVQAITSFNTFDPRKGTPRAWVFGGQRARLRGVLGDRAHGTVSVSVGNASSVAGANAALHALHARVVVVPVRPGCAAIGSLPRPGRPCIQRCRSRPG